METAIPVERKPLFRGMGTAHQCAYHVVMRFAQRGQIAMGGVIPTALRDGGGSKYEKQYGWKFVGAHMKTACCRMAAGGCVLALTENHRCALVYRSVR